MKGFYFFKSKYQLTQGYVLFLAIIAHSAINCQQSAIVQKEKTVCLPQE